MSTMMISSLVLTFMLSVTTTLARQHRMRSTYEFGRRGRKLSTSNALQNSSHRTMVQIFLPHTNTDVHSEEDVFFRSLRDESISLSYLYRTSSRQGQDDPQIMSDQQEIQEDLTPNNVNIVIDLGASQEPTGGVLSDLPAGSGIISPPSGKLTSQDNSVVAKGAGLVSSKSNSSSSIISEDNITSDLAGEGSRVTGKENDDKTAPKLSGDGLSKLAGGDESDLPAVVKNTKIDTSIATTAMVNGGGTPVIDTANDLDTTSKLSGGTTSQSNDSVSNSNIRGRSAGLSQGNNQDMIGSNSSRTSADDKTSALYAEKAPLRDGALIASIISAVAATTVLVTSIGYVCVQAAMKAAATASA